MGSPLSAAGAEALRRMIEDATTFLIEMRPADTSSLRSHLGYEIGRIVHDELDRAVLGALAKERERMTRPSQN